MKRSTLLAGLTRLTVMAVITPMAVFGFLYAFVVRPQQYAAQTVQRQLDALTAQLTHQRAVRRAPIVTQPSPPSQLEGPTVENERAQTGAESKAAPLKAPARVPLRRGAPTGRDRAEPLESDPVVSGILSSSGRRLALIGGRVVAAGDRVGSAVVLTIEPEAVIIATAEGKTRRIELNRPAIRVSRP